jgi:hypothetical protein
MRCVAYNLPLLCAAAAGGGLRDSFLVDGVAFKKTFSYAGFEQQPKSFTSECPCSASLRLWLSQYQQCVRASCTEYTPAASQFAGNVLMCAVLRFVSVLVLCTTVAHQAPLMLFKRAQFIASQHKQPFSKTTHRLSMYVTTLPACRPQDPAAQHRAGAQVGEGERRDPPGRPIKVPVHRGCRCDKHVCCSAPSSHLKCKDALCAVLAGFACVTGCMGRWGRRQLMLCADVLRSSIGLWLTA